MNNLTTIQGQTQVQLSKEELAVVHSEVFTKVAKILPVVKGLYGGELHQEFPAKALHAVVGGTYRLSAWTERVIESCRLKPGVHFRTEILDTSNEDPDVVVQAMKAAFGKGEVPTRVFFTREAVNRIVLRSNSDLAFDVADYLNALAVAESNKYVALVEEKQRLLEGEKLANERITARSEDLAKALGFSSPVLARNHVQQVKALQSQIDKLSMAGAACEGYSRALTRAAAHLKSKKLAPDEFIQELFEVDNRMKDGDVGYVPYF